jgi:hypothetical protein
MNARVLRGCAAALAVTVGALAGCSSSHTPSTTSNTSSAIPSAGTAHPSRSSPSSTPSGTLADVLLPGSDLPADLRPVPAQDSQNLGPAHCRRVAETYATSLNITSGGEGIQIEVSDCSVLVPQHAVTWLVESGMYGQPNFTDVTAPAIMPGSNAIAEIATPTWFSPPTASVREVVVTWAYENVVATVLVLAHMPFVSYASENGAEALARLQAARITSFASLLYYCAGTLTTVAAQTQCDVNGQS